MPFDMHGLARQREEKHQQSGGRVLNHGRAAQIDTGAEAFLVERAEAYAERRGDDGCERSEVLQIEGDATPQNEEEADQAEGKAEPLTRGHRLAEQQADE